MMEGKHFWRLEHLSDRQLLERLHGVLSTQRGALAELIAHLGEVEERRLHLAAAHGSLFSYCVRQLGMSEDEACRRIDLARLARKFPLLFGEIASGRLSLSVALLLKPVLTPGNHTELIAAARGASLRTARELLAARFPSPDVPSRIRKLPERHIAHAIPGAASDVAHAMPAAAGDIAHAMPAAASDVAPARVALSGGNAGTATTPTLPASPPSARSTESEFGSCPGIPAKGMLQAPLTPAEPSLATAPAVITRDSKSRPHQRIDPLSAERYRIVFTGDAHLKQKLELARDLLRHSHPNGDLALVVSRALDLLLPELLQRRFGARRKDAPRRAARARSRAVPETAAAPPPPNEAPRSSEPPVAVPVPARPVATAFVTAAATTARPGATRPPGAPAQCIARSARRVVLERDGLGCCWVDAQGNRCGSTAWLELDHHHPSGKGGNSVPENLRLLCRAHNRFAAERAYGRDHVERAIRARQQSAKRRSARAHLSPYASAPA